MNVIQTLILVALLLSCVIFIVIFSARIFAAAIAQESILQDKEWELQDKRNDEKIRLAKDAAAGSKVAMDMNVV